MNDQVSGSLREVRECINDRVLNRAC